MNRAPQFKEVDIVGGLFFVGAGLLVLVFRDKLTEKCKESEAFATGFGVIAILFMAAIALYF